MSAWEFSAWAIYDEMEAEDEAKAKQQPEMT